MKIKVEGLGRFGARDGGGMRAWILVAAVLTVACGSDPGPGSGGGDTTSGSTSGVGGHGGVGGVGAGGAGGAGQGGSGGTVQAQVDTWCASVYSGHCKALYACCPKPSVLDNWEDEADCAAETVAACSNYDDWNGDMARVIALVIEGVATLDEVRLASCIAAEFDAQALSCDSVLPLRLYRCLAAFQGNIRYGQACSLSDDMSYAECGNGHCDDGICQPYVPNGGACSAPGALCDWTLGSACIADLTCGQPVAQGQPCTQAGDCISRSCDVDGTSTCQAPTSDELCGVISN